MLFVFVGNTISTIRVSSGTSTIGSDSTWGGYGNPRRHTWPRRRMAREFEGLRQFVQTAPASGLVPAPLPSTLAREEPHQVLLLTPCVLQPEFEQHRGVAPVEEEVGQQVGLERAANEA